MGAGCISIPETDFGSAALLILSITASRAARKLVIAADNSLSVGSENSSTGTRSKQPIAHSSAEFTSPTNLGIVKTFLVVGVGLVFGSGGGVGTTSIEIKA